MTEGGWTPSPFAEREAVAFRRRFWGQEALKTTVMALMFVVLPVVALLAPASMFLGAYLKAMAGALTIAGAAGFYLFLRDRLDAVRRLVNERDVALRDAFSEGEGWLVNLLVLQGAAPTGTDRGMMWVEDGRLYFVGHRTSFGLLPDQTAGRSRWREPVPGLRLALSLPLDRRTAAGPLSLTFAPVVDPKEAAEVSEAIDAWRHASEPLSPRGEGILGSGQTSTIHNPQSTIEIGQFPPTELGPGAARPGGLLAVALGTSLYWFGGTAIALVTLTGNEAAAVIVVLWLLARPFGLWNLRLRWQAWLDRRRVAR